jgi:uncharacterized protein (TIGR03086 family)
MELLEALTQTFDHTAKIVDGVQPSQLDGPTPCRDWDLRALLGHMTGVVVNMGRGANGEELLPDPSAFQLDADPAAQFRTEADRALAAWTAHGSDGEVNIGAGPMPVPVAMSINILDTSTHSWDIARATGQDGNLPDDLATTALTLCQGIVTDDVRGFAGFDPIVPVGPDASATDQLVAFLGRTP